MTIFQAAPELIEVRTHRTRFHRLRILFHQQSPRGSHRLVLGESSTTLTLPDWIMEGLPVIRPEWGPMIQATKILDTLNCPAIICSP